ncbi:hypothetical protein MUN89_03095 [Halobacillus salinarum]|uniref:Uncharacterized protein n=1 Tax=Halobacillus salinarum TaxID=2932257 RepID=A0ABY4ELR2_9BACI|nr:hypothetical protein [Halobacillus salinarum]UOQ44952.1 hypothetical protein MUN89_03095 [Halobacillus salinarum]
MMKTVAATGLALSLGFASLGSVSAHEDNSTSIDLQTKVEAAIDDGETVTKSKLEAWAEANNWEMEDLQAWAKAEGMTETDLQHWAEDNGWSEEESAKLDLNVDADIDLDNLLESDDDEYGDDDDGLIGGILGDIL